MPVRFPLSMMLLVLLLLAIAMPSALIAQVAKPPEEGDKIVLIGNTLAERMQHFGHWETLLHSRFPDKKLVVRNLAWSGDTVTDRMRSLDFQVGWNFGA